MTGCGETHWKLLMHYKWQVLYKYNILLSTSIRFNKIQRKTDGKYKWVEQRRDPVPLVLSVACKSSVCK